MFDIFRRLIKVAVCEGGNVYWARWEFKFLFLGLLIEGEPSGKLFF